MCVCALTWFSFLERLLSRQRKAQSYIGNPGTQTAESHFLGPRVNPGMVNFVGTFALPCGLFFLLSAPPISLSLSLGHFPKKSNTDINTGRVQLLFPQYTQYVNDPSSFIGRAGWWQAPTDLNNGCLCRICSLCLARGPSTGTTEDSAEEGTKQLLMKCAQQTETIQIAWPRRATLPYKYWQRPRDRLSEVGNKALEGSEQCRKQCDRQQTWVMTLTVTRTQCRSMGSPPDFTPPSISASRLMLLTRRMLMSFSQQKAWIKVKWIWRATSSSSSVASRHNTTLSGSLKARQQERAVRKTETHVALLDLMPLTALLLLLTYAFSDFAAS